MTNNPEKMTNNPEELSFDLIETELFTTLDAGEAEMVLGGTSTTRDSGGGQRDADNDC
jgi:hypothetical protein